MEADLFLVLLLIRTVVLSPLNYVFNFCYSHVVLCEYIEYVLVMETFSESVYVSFCSEADAVEAGVLGCLYSFFKLALISECP